MMLLHTHHYIYTNNVIKGKEMLESLRDKSVISPLSKLMKYINSCMCEFCLLRTRGSLQKISIQGSRCQYLQLGFQGYEEFRFFMCVFCLYTETLLVPFQRLILGM